MFKRRKFLISISYAFSLVACDNQKSKSQDETSQRLIGRWLEESSIDGVPTRSILVIEQNGSFTELEKIVDSKGVVGQDSHAGEWAFDGVNFKRKYTQLNGKNLTNAKFGYSAYAVKGLDANGFTGLDNVRVKEVRFVRTTSLTP